MRKKLRNKILSSYTTIPKFVCVCVCVCVKIMDKQKIPEPNFFIWPLRLTIQGWPPFDWLSDWLILMACQPLWGHFMLRDQGITFIIHLYSNFLCRCFWRVFCRWSHQIQIISIQIYLTPRWDPNSTTTLDQSGPGSNDNEEILHTPQFFRASLLYRV